MNCEHHIAQGPFRLGRPLILVCIVEGGDPLPHVVWFRDGAVEDAEGGATWTANKNPLLFEIRITIETGYKVTTCKVKSTIK